jgi:hypothetical protein
MASIIGCQNDMSTQADAETSSIEIGKNSPSEEVDFSELTHDDVIGLLNEKLYCKQSADITECFKIHNSNFTVSVIYDDQCSSRSGRLGSTNIVGKEIVVSTSLSVYPNGECLLEPGHLLPSAKKVGFCPPEDSEIVRVFRLNSIKKDGIQATSPYASYTSSEDFEFYHLE